MTSTYEFTSPAEWDEAYGGLPTKRAVVHVRDPDGWIASIHHHLLQAEQDIALLARKEEEGCVIDEKEKQDVMQSYEVLKDEMWGLYDILKSKKATKPAVGEKQLSVLFASQQMSTCLWTNLAVVESQEGKAVANRVLLDRNQKASYETRECFNRKRKAEMEKSEPRKKRRANEDEQTSGGNVTPSPLASRDGASVTPLANGKRRLDIEDGYESSKRRMTDEFSSVSNSLSQGEAGWLKEILEKLSAKGSSSKPPSMKLPETYDGSDVSKFRSWWRSVKRYMRIYESAMRQDEVKITWIGSLLRGEALNWYHAREGRHELAGTQDEWTRFRDALEKRFVDTLEKRKDETAMRKLRYGGSISNYLAQIDEYNGRVGMTGITFRNMIIEAMPEKVIDMVFNRIGGIPEDDEILLETVRIAGQIVEENQRIKNSISGLKRKTSEREASEPPMKKQRVSKERDQIWKSFDEAFKGVPQSELNEYRSSGGCRRCGKDGHRALHCFAKRSIKGTELPSGGQGNGGQGGGFTRVNAAVDEPEKEVTSAVVAGVLRHQDDTLDHTRIWEIDSSDDEQGFW